MDTPTLAEVKAIRMAVLLILAAIEDGNPKSKQRFAKLWSGLSACLLESNDEAVRAAERELAGISAEAKIVSKRFSQQTPHKLKD